LLFLLLLSLSGRATHQGSLHACALRYVKLDGFNVVLQQEQTLVEIADLLLHMALSRSEMAHTAVQREHQVNGAKQNNAEPSENDKCNKRIDDKIGSHSSSFLSSSSGDGGSCDAAQARAQASSNNRNKSTAITIQMMAVVIMFPSFPCKGSGVSPEESHNVRPVEQVSQGKRRFRSQSNVHLFTQKLRRRRLNLADVVNKNK
jgi:hypothetical protein